MFNVVLVLIDLCANSKGDSCNCLNKHFHDPRNVSSIRDLAKICFLNRVIAFGILQTQHNNYSTTVEDEGKKFI